MGLVFCAAPLLVLGVLLLALNRHGKGADGSGKPYAAKVQRLIGIGLLVAGLLAALLFEPYFKPERYLKTIEEHAAPLVAAIDAFDAQHGAPPERLEQLVPQYLERIPTTGCRPFQEFHYSYRSSLTQPRYSLSVSTGGWNIDEDPGFYYDSWTRRWGFSAH